MAVFYTLINKDTTVRVTTKRDFYEGNSLDEKMDLLG